MRLKFSSVGTNKSLPIENRRLPAAVLRKCDAGQNEDHRKVAKRVNLVAPEEDTDNERHDRRDGGNACSSDGAKLFNDVLDKSTADHLASLLNEVLTNPTYRENARTLQKAIAEANGLSFAADLIEASLGMSRKISVAAA